MPNDALERLGRANPVPHDPPAPPIEPLLDRLDGAPAGPAVHRLPGALGVGLAVGVAVLVAVIALGVAGRRRPTVAGSVPPAARQHQHVHVQVTQADRYCTTRRGDALERCPKRPRRLIRLGGPSQQRLVIFSFDAPRSTTFGGRTYYYYTAEVPGQCPNVNQFGEYTASVRAGQRVVLWAAFDKDCPGAGRGTISLITRHNNTSAPGGGSQQPIASFDFTIPH